MPSSTEQNEHMQKELNTLRAENERLQRRKDELEMLLEQASVKDAFNIDRGGRELKIVHMAMNPADEAHENHKNEVDKLRVEVNNKLKLIPITRSQPYILQVPIYSLLNLHFQIERLKRKIRKMEDDHQDLTNRLNETTTAANTTINIQEVSDTIFPLFHEPRTNERNNILSHLLCRSMLCEVKFNHWKINSNTTKKSIGLPR